MGEQGSGAIFFSHCPLGCVFCQNKALVEGEGIEVSIARLVEIMLELQDDHHAANINLVTASHYAPSVVEALKVLRRPNAGTSASLTIPIVWNTSGYESPDMLDMLDGLVDVYLVDFKFASSEIASRLSHARDYPEVALAAIQTMLDQVGKPQFDGAGLMTKGVIIRHLVLPGYVDDSFEVLKIIHERFEKKVLVSIMNQFTILEDSFDHEAYGLERVVSDEDYERILDHADELGLEDYFWQEGGAASESFIPLFDGTGVIAS